jgi:hypothetical protein
MKVMKKPYLALMALAALTLSSCGDSDKQYTYTYQEFETIQVSSQNEFQSQVKRASVSLNSPEGLALVVNRATTGRTVNLGTCTAFLVDDKTMMTNSHCIPDELKKNKSKNCADYMGFVFRSKGEKHTRFCKQVKYFSEIGESKNKPDYALVELDSPVLNTRGFVVNRVGVESGGLSEIHSFDPKRSGGTIFGNYRKSTCVSKEKSIIGSFLESRSSIIPIFRNDIEAFNCNVIPGNSGSPAVKPGTRAAIGVVYAGQTKKFMQAFGKRDIDFSKLNKFGLLSNFACLDIPGHNRYRQLDCEDFLSKEKEERNKFNEQLVADSQKSLAQEISKKLADVPKTFIYENIAKKELMFNPSPTCMVPLEKWPQEEIDKIERTGFLYRDRTYKVVVPSLKIEFTFDIDKYGVLKEKLSVEKILDKVIEVTDVDDVETTSQKVGKVTMPSAIFRALGDIEIPLDTRLCTEKEMEKYGL